MRPSKTSPPVLADYQITPKGTSPTGHGPLGAPANKVRKPLRWFDPAEFPEKPPTARVDEVKVERLI